jgi:hypothetical protein
VTTRDTLTEIVRQWTERNGGLPETPEAVVDAYRAEVLAEVADMADPSAPEVSFFGGEVGPAVAAWLRMLADRKPTTPA